MSVLPGHMHPIDLKPCVSKDQTRVAHSTALYWRREWGRVGFARILALFFALLLPSPLFAEKRLLADPKCILQEKKYELDANAVKKLTIQSDVARLDAKCERLNSRLIGTAALIQQSERQMTAIEGRLSWLEEQKRIVRGSLTQRHGEIAALLSALQRMGRNPPPVLATRRTDALKMVRSAMLLASAFPDLRDQALALGTQLTDLQSMMSSIHREGVRLQAETDRLNEARTRLAILMEAKKLTLADRQSQLASVRMATADISKRVTSLSDLINKLDAAVTKKTGLGAYDDELKARHQVFGMQAASTAPASRLQIITPPSPDDAAAKVKASTQTAQTTPSALSVPPVQEAAAPVTVPAKKAAGAQPAPAKSNGQKVTMIELEPGGASLMSGGPGRIKPIVPFSDARGKLPLPAQGRRALAFGERTQFGGQSKGIVIETRYSAQVTSPCDGWVVYAGEFRSYGQLLIINAGDSYHMLLAGLSQIDVQPGQFVLTSEPVGIMGAGQKNSSSAIPVSGPVLYVELRKEGRPIDPNPWWALGQQKVQG